MPQKIRLLIANDKHESLASIKKLIASYSNLKLTAQALNGQEAVELAFKFQPDIIVMDTKMPVMDGFEATRKITQLAPHIGVILTGPAESYVVLRSAMWAGAGDFLEIPYTGAKLHHAISTLYEVKKEQRKHLIDNPLVIPKRHPQVISVFSSKGGTGKTFLATNIAVSLKKLTREDVLLVDMNLQFGDISSLFNIKPKNSILELKDNKDSIEVGETTNYLSTHSSGIKILTSPQEPEHSQQISGDDIKEIIDLLADTFDYIVIDLPSKFSEAVAAAINNSSKLLMLTAMDMLAIKNTKSGIELLKRLNYPEENITFILNKYSKHSDISPLDIKKFLGFQELNYIYYAPHLLEVSFNTGEPLVTMFKHSKVAMQIINLSRSLVDYKEAQRDKKQGLFDSILRKER